MRVVGYCTYGHHVRYVEVTSEALIKAQITGLIEGVCDSCRKEQEQAREATRERLARARRRT